MNIQLKIFLLNPSSGQSGAKNIRSDEGGVAESAPWNDEKDPFEVYTSSDGLREKNDLNSALFLIVRNNSPGKLDCF